MEGEWKRVQGEWQDLEEEMEESTGGAAGFGGEMEESGGGEKGEEVMEGAQGGVEEVGGGSEEYGGGNEGTGEEEYKPVIEATGANGDDTTEHKFEVHGNESMNIVSQLIDNIDTPTEPINDGMANFIATTTNVQTDKTSVEGFNTPFTEDKNRTGGFDEPSVNLVNDSIDSSTSNSNPADEDQYPNMNNIILNQNILSSIKELYRNLSSTTEGLFLTPIQSATVHDTIKNPTQTQNPNYPILISNSSDGIIMSAGIHTLPASITSETSTASSFDVVGFYPSYNETLPSYVKLPPVSTESPMSSVEDVSLSGNEPQTSLTHHFGSTTLGVINAVSLPSSSTGYQELENSTRSTVSGQSLLSTISTPIDHTSSASSQRITPSDLLTTSLKSSTASVSPHISSSYSFISPTKTTTMSPYIVEDITQPSSIGQHVLYPTTPENENYTNIVPIAALGDYLQIHANNSYSPTFSDNNIFYDDSDAIDISDYANLYEKYDHHESDKEVGAAIESNNTKEYDYTSDTSNNSNIDYVANFTLFNYTYLERESDYDQIVDSILEENDITFYEYAPNSNEQEVFLITENNETELNHPKLGRIGRRGCFSQLTRSK